MERLTAAVQELIDSVQELSKRVDVMQGVTDRLDNQDRAQHSTRMIVAALAVGLVLLMSMGTALGFLYWQVEQSQREIRAVQARTSAEILCPLYTVFATSIKVNPVNPNLTPEQTQFRQQAADTILAGLSKLGCA